MTPPLTPERWQALEPLLDAALEAPLERRARAIAELAGSDHALRDEALALLGKWTESGVLPLLGKPAPEVFSALLDDEMDGSFETLAAALAGRYTLERRLGQGGMATVYLAFDLKHDRRVALKVLRPELAAVVGADRFLAEIKTTANLRHPHILPLHDSGEAGSFLFYVMPYVEGESLAQRLERDKQLSVDEAVSIATKVSAALQHAHDRGVIHRDIKPANVLLQDGEPVVADFGIALVVGAVSGARLTETGLSLGTPFYMSPEQATGDQRVGAASDTYALGCVLYEMLVGEPPHIGKTAQAVLGNIISGELAFPRKRRPSIPANVDAAIRRALEKLPADRFRSVADFASALSNPAFRHGEIDSESTRVSTRWSRLTAGAGSIAAITIVTIVSSLLIRPPERAVARYPLAISNGELSDFDVAPDGSWIVYVSPGPEGNQLWVKHRDRIDAIPLTGTADARRLSVSPDGQWIAFVVQSRNQLNKVSVQGGAPIMLADRVNYNDSYAAWLDDGTILFSLGRGVGRVPASGGAAQTAWTAPDSVSHVVLPASLPNSRGVLFKRCVGPLCARSEIWILDLRAGEARALIPDGKWARYVSTGHIVFVRGDGSVFALPFDADALEIEGTPISLLNGIKVRDLALGTDGTLLMTAADSAASNQGNQDVVWVSRDGVTTPVEPGWFIRALRRDPALSPDGTRLAITLQTPEGQNIWVKHFDTGRFDRLTFTPGAVGSNSPRWSSNGQFVFFTSEVARARGLYQRAADGGGEDQLLAPIPGAWETTATPDGRWVVVRRGGVSGTRDVVAYRLDGDTAAVPLLVSPYEEVSPHLSPDGRWLTYVSDESGRSEVYVRPFPDVHSNRWLVSTDGGYAPLWAHSGRELFYLSTGGRMMAAAVSGGSSFQVSEPRALFELPLGTAAATVGAQVYRRYDVSPDDQRFIMVRDIRADATPAPLILVENWFEELKARVRR
jgi:serine/threonine protein kinase